MFSCNLPPALLAEWPGYFTCYCGNTGRNGYRNKSQHRKLTLEKKSLPPLLPGLEPATFLNTSLALKPLNYPRSTCVISSAVNSRHNRILLINNDQEYTVNTTKSLHACLLQAVDGVMPLALCPQEVSQVLQHFRSSGKQATCEGCFARH